MESCRRRSRTIKLVPDWLSLPHELLVEIAKLVIESGSMEDIMAFKGVCTSWRAASRDNECAKLFKARPKVPYLMLGEKEGGSNEREFYSLSKKKVCMRLPLPQAKGKRCIQSGHGWLLTLTASRGEVDHLLNPFTGERIALPGFFGFSWFLDRIKRSVLSANPSHTSDFVLVVLTERSLAYWRLGDKNWTKIKNENDRFLQLVDVNYCNRDGKFYAADQNNGLIYVWDANEPAKGLVIRLFSVGSMDFNMIYLVESSTGELLVVIRYRYSLALRQSFRVCRVDVAGHDEERVHNYLKDAIFVGSNAAFCLLPPPNTDIKSNHVYFTDDYDKDMGMYNLEDGSTRPFHENAETCKLLYSSLWIAPSSIPMASLKKLAS